MFVRLHYDSQPGVCSLCNTFTVPTVDTGVDLEKGIGYWRIYICRSCVHELGKLFDMQPGERVAQLTEALQQTQTQLAEAQTQIATSDRVLESLYGLVRVDKAEASKKQAVQMAKKNTRRQVIRELKQLGGDG